MNSAFCYISSHGKIISVDIIDGTITGSENPKTIDALDHLNKLRNDLEQSKKNCCYGCFIGDTDLKKVVCSKCNIRLLFWQKRRCPVCYVVLCKKCVDYAKLNMTQYREFIFKKKSK